MVRITKNITVTDRSGNAIGLTYGKRARQLVKKGRAYKSSDSAICLVTYGEVLGMDSVETANQIQSRIIPEDVSPVASEDSRLLELAKRRVAEKSKLKKHAACYIIGVPMSFVLYFGMLEYFITSEFLALFIVIWSFVFTLHIASYLFPSASARVIAFFTLPTNERIDLEYEKVKKFSPRRMEKEYKRLRKPAK